MDQEYENYGDVHPLDHGGIWVAHSMRSREQSSREQVGDTEFEIIKYNPEEKGLYDLLVDISDSWIERNGVMSYIGMTEETFDPILFAIGCVEYYSYANFGTLRIIPTEIEVRKFLEMRGIQV